MLILVPPVGDGEQQNSTQEQEIHGDREMLRVHDKEENGNGCICSHEVIAVELISTCEPRKG